ncbi:hypothetical protein Bca52824_023559 [Brassica carinata]|uniref:Prolyl 4-hydroxylase alpha subunit domain-containing protein n=1 Tax=Brassica carinata TaxID=52824 RepID=A0A8X7VIS7_BRACI|nr:hypothetical protein Bca52824_023559 [Brassica carinata]
MTMPRRGLLLPFVAVFLILLQLSTALISSPSSIINPSKVKQVSSKPRAFVYEGFLTDLECDHLISLDPIVSGIEDKLSTSTFLPKENGEDLQVLRYEHGQKYDAHFDYFHDKVNIARGGHRMATVLMYLSNVKKGGETVFPDEVVPCDDLSDCAKKGIAVKPKKGSCKRWAVLGECAKNPEYMVGTPELPGNCRRSCKAC